MLNCPCEGSRSSPAKGKGAQPSASVMANALNTARYSTRRFPSRFVDAEASFDTAGELSTVMLEVQTHTRLALAIHLIYPATLHSERHASKVQHSNIERIVSNSQR